MMAGLITKQQAKGAIRPFCCTEPQVLRFYHAIDALADVDAVQVVRCKDCQHCRLLNDGISFECMEQEVDYYAPTYDAATYYCADGKRRDEHCT